MEQAGRPCSRLLLRGLGRMAKGLMHAHPAGGRQSGGRQRGAEDGQDGDDDDEGVGDGEGHNGYSP